MDDGEPRRDARAFRLRAPVVDDRHGEMGSNGHDGARVIW
jgi:hypothetical protein